MENLESQGIYYKYFSFQAWKVMEFHFWSWKIIVCVVGKLLQVPKQEQNKLQTNYVRKYPKTRMILTIFKIAAKL